LVARRRPAPGLDIYAMAFLGLLGLAGCGGQQPVANSALRHRPLTHVVRRGETIHRIARYYGISATTLMEANGIRDPRQLRVGQVLVIPGRYETATIGGPDALMSGPVRPPPPRHAFQWPIEGGVLSSPFGMRHGVMHDGIDIAAPVGTAVFAADSGVVIYAGRLRGYGNIIIIRHSDHFATVYGHDSVNRVSTGEHVRRGQVIGSVGTSGRTTGPNLHFEVRYDNLAYNPLLFLPEERVQSAETFAGRGGS
jgi:lipoprotein NlpD